MTKRNIIAGLIDVVVLFTVFNVVGGATTQWIGLGAACFVAAYGFWSFYDGNTR